MTVPNLHDLALPVLQFLARRGPTRLSEIISRVGSQLGLSEEDRSERIPSGQPRFDNRIGWALYELKTAKLVQQPSRAIYEVTAAGNEVLVAPPERIDGGYLRRFPAYAAAQEKRRFERVPDPRTSDQVSLDSTPHERIASAHQEIRQAVKNDLLDRILQKEPTFFEHLVLELLQAMGYGGSDRARARHTGKAGDEGLDGVIDEDKLGLDSIYLQAKRYQPGQNVSRPDLQRFVGSMQGKSATKGVFVTTSTFAGTAHAYVETVAQRVVLIDGDRLAELMYEHGVGVREEQVYALKALDENFFED